MRHPQKKGPWWSPLWLRFQSLPYLLMLNLLAALGAVLVMALVGVLAVGTATLIKDSGVAWVVFLVLMYFCLPVCQALATFLEALFKNTRNWLWTGDPEKNPPHGDWFWGFWD